MARQPYTSRFNWTRGGATALWLVVGGTERCVIGCWRDRVGRAVVCDWPSGGTEGERLNWSAGLCRYLTPTKQCREKKCWMSQLPGGETPDHTDRCGTTGSNTVARFCPALPPDSERIRAGLQYNISCLICVTVYLCCFTFQWCESEKRTKIMTARSRVHYWTAPI